MEFLTETQQYAGGDKCFPRSSPGSARHFRSERVVVVLGVMYPSVLPKLVAASTHRDLVLLPPGLTTDRQSVDVVFYDPLASSWNGDEVPVVPKLRRKSKGDGYVNPREAQEAVAHDLALLSLKNASSHQLSSALFQLPLVTLLD